jgi:hypothetical protein
MVHPFAIASTYFIQKKVYPNEDAVRLIQELNPTIDMSAEAHVISGDTHFILPNYPPVNKNVLIQFKAEYLKDASRDHPDLNQSFKNLSDTFNQIFQRQSVPGDEAGKKYYDSLAFFNSRILPYINNSAQSISRLQMRYFITELKALNESLSKKKLPPVAYGGRPSVSHEIASYVIEDFYEIANPVQVKRSLYTQRVRAVGNSFEDKEHLDLIFFDGLQATPFACNLYIYGKDESGKRKQDPEMGSFDVWVGSKMKYDTRAKGSAPESYGFVKMGNPASTLPFYIGLGKWVVVMKKQGPDGVYLSKEISIYSETELEPEDPDARKVCYVLD